MTLFGLYFAWIADASDRSKESFYCCHNQFQTPLLHVGLYVPSMNEAKMLFKVIYNI